MLNQNQCRLTNDSKGRYARQILLPEIGEAGQDRLRSARILIVGVGGLGTPIALYLAAAGIGTLGLVDGDTVELSNLQRQVIFTTDDVGKLKVFAAAHHLSQLNPDIAIETHAESLRANNVRQIIRDYGLIIDGTDNFATHYLLNDACIADGKPLIYGSVERFFGQVGLVSPGQGPCYRCLHPEPPPPELSPSCSEIGVLGIVPGLVGSLQASEALKFILGIGKPLIGLTLRIDVLQNSFREYTVPRDTECTVCSNIPTTIQLLDCSPLPNIDAAMLRDGLSSDNHLLLIDVRNAEEFEASHIPGARLIPLPVLQEYLGDLEHDQEIVVYCQSGKRSSTAVRLLQENGFMKVRHLTGGIANYNLLDKVNNLA